MSNVNHVNTVQIESGANPVAGVGTPLQSLAKGQFALIESNTMTALDVAGAQALSANATVYIAVGQGGGEFLLSSKISGKDVTKYAGTDFASPMEQTMVVGGTSLAVTDITGLPIADETEYELIILIKDDQRVHGQKQTREVYSYVTGQSATQSEAAFAISSLFEARKQNGTDKKYGGRFVTLGVVASNTFATNGDNPATVVKGSKVISFATAATYSGGTDIAAGDVIQANTINSNGTSSYVNHLVVSVNGLNVTLDTPIHNIEGATGGSGIWAAADIEAIPEAIVPTLNYGFEITALVPSDDWNGIDTYETVMFDASYFASKDPTNDGTQAPSATVVAYLPGAGTGYQVYDVEYFAQGYRGVNSRTRWFDKEINPDFAAVVSSSYDSLTIVFSTEYRTDFQNTAKAPKAANLFFLNGSTQGTTGFVDILNGWFADVLGQSPVTFT